MLAPLKILDYIVVHELAHLLYPNHSTQFWNEVDKMMPDFQERKVWLREHGEGMDSPHIKNDGPDRLRKVPLSAWQSFLADAVQRTHAR